MPRGDGRLSHDLDFRTQPGPQDECGVFGVWAPGEEVVEAHLLRPLRAAAPRPGGRRHRRQRRLAAWSSTRTSAWWRRSSTSRRWRACTVTSRSGTPATPPPARPPGRTRSRLRTTATGTSIALAHNGNLVNTAELAAQAAERGRAPSTAPPPTPTLITGLLAADPDLSVEAAALRVLPTLRGRLLPGLHATSTRSTPPGTPTACTRWCSAGWTAAGWWPARPRRWTSSAPAFVREVEPGELLAIDERRAALDPFATRTRRAACSSTSTWPGPTPSSPAATCTPPGWRSAAGWPREHPADADLVIGVPESGTPAAIGYAEASGIPYGAGLVKNSYVGRTFIQPSQTMRQLGIRLKLNPLRDVIRGKRLVVVDDSIVRGNTQRAIVRMLRESGAVEVHVRISVAAGHWPCFYGIDFASRAELIANGMDTEGVRRSIGADCLGYVSLAGLIAATEQPKTRLCRACFDGEYPIDLPAGHLIGKHVLEGVDRRVMSRPDAAGEPDDQESQDGQRATARLAAATPRGET